MCVCVCVLGGHMYIGGGMCACVHVHACMHDIACGGMVVCVCVCIQGRRGTWNM